MGGSGKHVVHLVSITKGDANDDTSLRRLCEAGHYIFVRFSGSSPMYISMAPAVSTF